uniref:Integrase catalytic domain-containing protein n=1 Tax=Cannabis sativa TaxID=3483 RepID=A0A803PQG1_CANSA
MPPEKLHLILTTWPFMKWGVNIIGMMPIAQGQRVFMLAATDYFTKWVKVEAYAQVRDREVKSFIWKNVICRFGVPKEIVTDNDSQFISLEFQNFCNKWGILLSFSTPRYPQSNGKVESTNKTVVASLKKRLDKAKRRWEDELPGMLWAHRTTIKTSIRETPFSLTYRTEEVIPVEARLQPQDFNTQWMLKTRKIWLTRLIY